MRYHETKVSLALLGSLNCIPAALGINEILLTDRLLVLDILQFMPILWVTQQLQVTFIARLLSHIHSTNYSNSFDLD